MSTLFLTPETGKLHFIIREGRHGGLREARQGLTSVPRQCIAPTREPRYSSVRGTVTERESKSSTAATTQYRTSIEDVRGCLQGWKVRGNYMHFVVSHCCITLLQRSIATETNYAHLSPSTSNFSIVHHGLGLIAFIVSKSYYELKWVSSHVKPYQAPTL